MRIALYQPDIPQNSGNIFRLGACFGISIDIIEPAGYIFDDKRFRRSSMDYINHIDYKRHIDWETFFNRSKKNNFRLILLTTKVDKKYYLSERIKKTILSEGTGGYKYKADYNLLTSRPLTFTMHKMHRASQDNYYSDSFINGKYDDNYKSVIESKEGKNNIRRITPKEALLLQGFNKRFIDKALKSGLSDTRLYMLAGNSVPTKLVKAVSKHLIGVK